MQLCTSTRENKSVAKLCYLCVLSDALLNFSLNSYFLVCKITPYSDLISSYAMSEFSFCIAQQKSCSVMCLTWFAFPDIAHTAVPMLKQYILCSPVGTHGNQRPRISQNGCHCLTFNYFCWALIYEKCALNTITQQLLKLPVKRRKAASWILDYSAYCPLSAWSPFRLHSYDRYPFLKYGRWTLLIQPIPARAVFLNQFSHRFSAGLSDKQLLQPSVDALELGSDRELQRSLSRWADTTRHGEFGSHSDTLRRM